MAEKNIAIIGSGPGGLGLAYYLQKKSGYKIDVYEKSAAVGGLAKTMDIEGVKLEQFYHHIFTTDKYIIDLIKELGLEHELKWYDDNTAVLFNDILYPFKSPLDLLKFAPLNPEDRIRMGAVLFYLTKTNNWKKLELSTAHEWMLKYAGRKGYETLWEPLLYGKFQHQAKSITMSWLWARLKTRANSNGKLGYMNGSFDVFFNKLTQAVMEKKGNFILNADINLVDSIENKIRIAYSQKKGEEVIKEYDKVIITTPSKVYTSFLKGLSNEYIENVNAIEYLSAQTIVLTLNKSLTPYYWISVNDKNLPALAVIEQTNLNGAYNNKHIIYIGNYLQNNDKVLSMNEDALKERYYPFLKKLNPLFEHDWVIDFKIFRAPFAQPIVDTSYHSHIPSFQSPIENIFIMNMSQVYPEDRGMNFAIKNALTLLEQL